MIKKINAEQLEIGMYIVDTDRKWLDLPFFRTRFPVTSAKQVATLREYCRFVCIDTAKGKDISDSPPAGAIPSSADLDTTTWEGCYAAVRLGYADVLRRAAAENTLDFATVDKLAAELEQGISPDSGRVWGGLMRDTQPDPAAKAVNAAALALVWGLATGLSAEALRHLGSGALLLDIGLQRLPDAIRAAERPLDAGETALFRQHPQCGRDMLLAASDVPIEVLDIVLNHHERADGSGYPRGLGGGDLSRAGQIAAMAAECEDLCWEHAGRPARSGLQALASIYNAGARLFDGDLTADFVRALGVWPPGCLVELAGGELAVVGDIPASEFGALSLRPVTNSAKELLDFAADSDRTVRVSASEIVRILSLADPIARFVRYYLRQCGGH